MIYVNEDGTDAREGYLDRPNREPPWVIVDPDEPLRMLFEWEVLMMIGSEARYIVERYPHSSQAELRDVSRTNHGPYARMC